MHWEFYLCKLSVLEIMTYSLSSSDKMSDSEGSFHSDSEAEKSGGGSDSEVSHYVISLVLWL